VVVRELPAVRAARELLVRPDATQDEREKVFGDLADALEEVLWEVNRPDVQVALSRLVEMHDEIVARANEGRRGPGRTRARGGVGDGPERRP